MKLTIRASVLLAAMMALSGAAAKLMTPTHFLSQQLPPIQLEQMVPARFGDWQEEKQLVGAVVNPETAAMLKKLYTQTLSRTYINSQGERVMLSIAYGGDQRDGMQVHYPEVCYPAQGFQLEGMRQDVLSTGQGPIPVKRLLTVMGSQRHEPVTYWTTVGQQVVLGGIDKKLAEVRYALHGSIADGLLFRVSSIDRDSAASFARQDGFVRDMMAALPPASRQRLAGLGAP
jgi:EpsI family protein